MKKYEVSFEVEVEANNFEEAADNARDAVMQRKADESIAEI